MNSNESGLPIVDTNRVTRAVVISQMLFTAGHSLTTGGFLYYFAYSFGPSAFFLAALQIAPETSEAFSFITRTLLNRFQSRKWLWVYCLLFGRIAALLIPCSLFFQQNADFALVTILISICLWHLLQGIAYCSYISWLSELVPTMNWGTFFAKRKMASLLIAIIVPTSAGLMRKAWISQLPKPEQNWSYGIIFGIGAILVMASILPMLKIPDRPVRKTASIAKSQRSFSGFLSADFRWLLASRWWLAFFQGLTQVVIFKYSVDILQIELEEYYQLSGMMLLIQIATSWWGGKICDRGHELSLLMLSLTGVSFAMYFWCIAETDSKWLATGAYLIWGGFGFVNIALQYLTLKLAPAGDNSFHISLSRQSSGFIAGIAGLIGGIWLDQLLKNANWSVEQSFYLLFIISWVGRATAAFWLLPIRSQRDENNIDSVDNDPG